MGGINTTSPVARTGIGNDNCDFPKSASEISGKVTEYTVIFIIHPILFESHNNDSHSH